MKTSTVFIACLVASCILLIFKGGFFVVAWIWVNFIYTVVRWHIVHKQCQEKWKEYDRQQREAMFGKCDLQSTMRNSVKEADKLYNELREVLEAKSDNEK